MRRAIFLDRDGVINEAVSRGGPFGQEGTAYTAPFTPDEFKLLPDTVEGLNALRALGMLLIVVTNQPDVVYGHMTQEAFEEIMRRTRALGFEDVFVCTHGRDEGCACKKPKPGMLENAAAKWGIDLTHSYMIGDTETDTEAGRAAGVKTILLKRRYNEDRLAEAVPDMVADSLVGAASLIRTDIES